ncbi:MAG: hypothetical protein IJD32_07320 [Bacteroidaceae bacterium]|nr:hypothetical protein [Bacteroidaceae bacterium]
MYIKVTERDVKALEVYLRLLKMPSTYCMEEDLKELMHWLDLTSNDFVYRLRKAYPQLTHNEINLCCLLRMGYSWEKITAMMGVKERTVYRTLYRACNHMSQRGSKEGFKTFIQGY